jgi:hypothetical protein
MLKMLFNLPSFADKPVTLTFCQLNINPADYNGLPFSKIRPEYINIAADYLLDITGDRDYETFAHYEWEIDYLAGLIKIPRSAFI